MEEDEIEFHQGCLTKVSGDWSTWAEELISTSDADFFPGYPGDGGRFPILLDYGGFSLGIKHWGISLLWEMVRLPLPRLVSPINLMILPEMMSLVRGLENKIFSRR